MASIEYYTYLNTLLIVWAFLVNKPRYFMVYNNFFLISGTNYPKKGDKLAMHYTGMLPYKS